MCARLCLGRLHGIIVACDCWKKSTTLCSTFGAICRATIASLTVHGLWNQMLKEALTFQKIVTISKAMMDQCHSVKLHPGQMRRRLRKRTAFMSRCLSCLTSVENHQFDRIPSNDHFSCRLHPPGLYFFQICQSVYFQLLLHCRSLFSFFIFFFSQPRIFYRYVGRLTDRRVYCLRSFLLRSRDRTSAPIAFFLLKLFLVPFRDNCHFRRIRFSW